MRIGIMSDIHSNAPALEAAFHDMAEQQLDAIWCLGDAVGYYPYHSQVLARLREMVTPGAWVVGNHDCGVMGSISARHFSVQARFALDKTRAELASSDLDWLANLPQRVELTLDNNLTATLVHATPDDPIGAYDGMLKNPETALRVASLWSSRFCCIGHTHLRQVFIEEQPTHGDQPTWRQIDVNEYYCPDGRIAVGQQRMIINPGSIGQPRDGFGSRHDGFPHASYAILDTEAGFCQYRRVAYDLDALQAATRLWLADSMPAAALQILIERLASNIG